LDDLIDACSEALYEYEGITKGVSRRTIQLDLQVMRSEKLGYNAPIVIEDRKYYTYSDPNYSITNIPLTEDELMQLSAAVDVLRQFKGFSIFKGLRGMVQKLEDRIASFGREQQAIIGFEKNDNLRGLDHLDTLYEAIQAQKTVSLLYHSFKATKPREFVFHPYFLQEYRNRWFLLGVRGACMRIQNLALDRILEARESFVPLIKSEDFDPETHFKDVIGVTVFEEWEAEEIRLWITASEAPYIMTKPFHPSQRVLQSDNKGTIISLYLKMNYELEREILGLGEAVKVMAPAYLQEKIRLRLKLAAENYVE
jgi:predicted DNA-binding transcriptional regulator YafY